MSANADEEKKAEAGDVETKQPEGDNERGNWSNPLDFILSLVGYSVGLGNIWRFPYLCMRNGGGAFLIPYFTFLLLCGMPLFYLEVTIGQFSNLSALHVWRMAPLFKGLGWAMMLISGIWAMYFNVIIAWVLYYLFMSFTSALPWGTCDGWWNSERCIDRAEILSNSTANVTLKQLWIERFNASVNDTPKWRTPAEEFWVFNVLEISPGIHDMGGIKWQMLVLLFVSWLIVFLCLIKGVHSLGKVVYVTATTPYVFLIILLVRGLTLDGAMDGVKFYITPDWNRLLEFQVWGEACQQIFYTLGPAWGGLITMASYNKFKNNQLRDAILVAICCCGTSFFCGFVIFSIIGFMAKEVNLPVKEVLQSGPGLAFIAYPEALNRLPLSPMWAIFFFLMLLLVGLDSQFGAFETLVSGFVDMFPNYLQKRKTLFTAFMAFIMFLLGLPFVCRGGIYVFQLIDWYAPAFACMVIALLEIICVCAVYGVRRVSYDIKLMSGRPLNVWFMICWCIITPLSICMILVMNMWQMSEPSYGEYEFPRWSIGVGWGLAMISMIPIPLYAVVLIIRQEGPLLQRVKNLLKPDPRWGPGEQEYRLNYRYNLGDTGGGGLTTLQMDPLLTKQ